MPEVTDTSINISSANITTKVRATNVTPVVDNPKTSKKLKNVTFQARLGKKLDNISRKVIDNQIRLTSNPTDMLRIQAQRDPQSGDLISRTISEAEVMPIILPVLKDIPLRHFIRETEDIVIPSLYTTVEQEYFEVYAPIESHLLNDDLLIRLLGDPNADEPYIMVLQVKEILGTFGYSNLKWMKYWVTFYDEKLPAKVIQLIKKEINKREALTW